MRSPLLIIMFNRLKNKNGFTLIELILVIVTLGIIAYAAIPVEPGLAPISLDAAARKLKSDIRYAQNMATTTGEPHGFRATGESTYEIYNALSSSVITSPVTHLPMKEDLSASFGKAKFQDISYLVVFDNLGRPSLGGGTIIIINDPGSATPKQVHITNNSGFVSLL